MASAAADKPRARRANGEAESVASGMRHECLHTNLVGILA